MQKNNKGFAKLFVVMLAVVFGALAVYFLVGRNISPAVQDIAPTVGGINNSTGEPDWVKKFISESQNDPTASLIRYEYKNQTVYFKPVTKCCDQMSTVLDENGDYLCSPDGGFTGRGDGKCADFFQKRKNEKVLLGSPESQSSGINLPSINR